MHKADFSKANEILSDINRDNIFVLCHDDPRYNSFVELFRLTVLQFLYCVYSSPKKPRKTISSIYMPFYKYIIKENFSAYNFLLFLIEWSVD